MSDENVVAPQPSPTPSPSQGMNWKNIIIGVIIGAVLFGGGGYLVYNAYQPKKAEPTQTTTTTKTATPSITTKEEPKDETADWKTYINKKLAFSIKYPNGWSYIKENLNPTKGENPIEYVSIAKKGSDVSVEGLIVQIIRVSEDALKDYKGPITLKTEYSSVLNKKVGDPVVEPDEFTGTRTVTRLMDMRVDGLTALVVKAEPGKDGFVTYNQSIYIKKSDIYYAIGITQMFTKKEFQSGVNTLNYMLSTFRFE